MKSPSPRIKFSNIYFWLFKAGNPRLYTSIASGPHYEVHSNGSLFVKNALEIDGGYYLCQANNKIGSGLSKVIFLTVHGTNDFLVLSIAKISNSE